MERLTSVLFECRLGTLLPCPLLLFSLLALVNWLAHIVLAGPAPEDQLGGVLADLVPLSVARELPPGILRGIALHLSIDAFSNAHPAAAASIRRITSAEVGLRPAAAAIAVDMLYDHLLARDWVSRGPRGVALDHFTSAFYVAVAALAVPLPPRASMVLAAMAAQDWLGSYRSIDNVRLALEGIRRRLSPSAAAVCPLAAAVDVFQHEPDAFAEDFARFWPDVTAHAQETLANPYSAAV